MPLRAASCTAPRSRATGAPREDRAAARIWVEQAPAARRGCPPKRLGLGRRNQGIGQGTRPQALDLLRLLAAVVATPSLQLFPSCRVLVARGRMMGIAARAEVVAALSV